MSCRARYNGKEILKAFQLNKNFIFVSRKAIIIILQKIKNLIMIFGGQTLRNGRNCV
jgi:hypothetical protein